MTLSRQLAKRAEENRPVRVGLIGVRIHGAVVRGVADTVVVRVGARIANVSDTVCVCWRWKLLIDQKRI